MICCSFGWKKIMTAHYKVFGVSWVTGDIAVEFFRCVFLGALSSTSSKCHLVYYIRQKAVISMATRSPKPRQLTPKRSRWINSTQGKSVFDLGWTVPLKSKQYWLKQPLRLPLQQKKRESRQVYVTIDFALSQFIPLSLSHTHTHTHTHTQLELTCRRLVPQREWA